MSVIITVLKVAVCLCDSQCSCSSVAAKGVWECQGGVHWLTVYGTPTILYIIHNTSRTCAVLGSHLAAPASFIYTLRLITVIDPPTPNVPTSYRSPASLRESGFTLQRG